MAATPRLRSRTSALDSRVTLVSMESEASTSLTPPSSRKSSQAGRAKDEASGAESSELSDVDQKPKKRRRTATDSRKAETPSVKKERAPRKAKPIQLALETAHPAPPRWEEAYDLIRTQRATITAPVDTMGCDQAGSHDSDAVAHLRPLSEKEQRLSVLVSLMLSSQTKDEVTAQAMLNLRLGLRGGFSIDSLNNASPEEIQACVNKVGFWRRKTEYIKEMAVVLREKHAGDVPKTLEELVALKGVGPKMAFLCLSSAWNLNSGIGVDTHVHRITNRLGWHQPPANTAEATRLNLESWLPKDRHQEINHMLVGFGQLICLPVGPRCDLCTLANDAPGLCPSQREVSKARQASGSPRKVATKKDASPVVKIEVEVPPVKREEFTEQTGTGVLKTGDGEAAIEGEVSVSDRDGQPTAVAERRILVKEERDAAGASISTEAVVADARSTDCIA